MVWVAWWDCKNHCINLIQSCTRHCRVLTWVTILKEALCHCINTLLKCGKKILPYHISKFWAIDSPLILCAYYCTLHIDYGHHEVGLLVSFLFPSCYTTHRESFRPHSPLSSSWCKSLVKWIFLVNEICTIKIKTTLCHSSRILIQVCAGKSSCKKQLSTFCQFQSFFPGATVVLFFMHLRTVGFDRCCKPASSWTRVEGIDPTVARRFKIVHFINLLSLLSSLRAFPIFNSLLFSGAFTVDIYFLQCLYTVALWYREKVLRSSMQRSPASW